MGIEVSFTPDGIGAVYTSSGVLTGQDLLDADTRLQRELGRNPGIRYLLVDHTAISEERIDSASIHALAERTREIFEWLPDGIVAIVAPSDVLFGLSRMWEIRSEQPRLITLVVRTRAEAIEWLRGELSRRQLPFQLAE